MLTLKKLKSFIENTFIYSDAFKFNKTFFKYNYQAYIYKYKHNIYIKDYIIFKKVKLEYGLMDFEYKYFFKNSTMFKYIENMFFRYSANNEYIKRIIKPVTLEKCTLNGEDITKELLKEELWKK